MIPLTPQFIRNTFYKALHKMDANREMYVKQPKKDFTRKATFSFIQTLLFITQMESHSTTREINDYFIPRKMQITQPAFVQARDKLNDLAFPALLQSFNSMIPFHKTKHGLHLLAIDGSDLNVPADIKDCSTMISYNSKNGSYHQLHANICYDLLEKRYVDAVIQPRALIREAAAACTMVDRNPISGSKLYLFDRGYECSNLIAHIVTKGDYFLIRAKEIHSNVSPFSSVPVPDTDEFDVPVRFIFTRSKKLYEQDKSLYKLLFKNRDFDFIAPDDRHTTFEINFRLIKVKLTTGNQEYLITNLPDRKFRTETVKDLYRQRWQIEVSFLFLKYGVELNFFHSIKRPFLNQEIYSKLILYNFISLIVSCVEVPFTGTKYKYSVSFSDAIYLCRDYLNRNLSYNNISQLLLLSKTPIRPDRIYPRNIRSQRLRTLQHRA